jgi:transposase-like protein
MSRIKTYRKDGAPKHTVKVNDRMLQAAELRSQGVPRAEIARRFGVSTHAVYRWIEKVQEHQADERNRRALGR